MTSLTPSCIMNRLCNEIFNLYAELDHETKPKNIAAWTPVVVSILNGLSQLQDEDVSLTLFFSFFLLLTEFYSS
jgi:hypothetical protein